jgi:hypothetical protein
MNIGGALTPVFFVLAFGYSAGKHNVFDAHQTKPAPSFLGNYDDLSVSIQEHIEERTEELMEEGVSREYAGQTARRESCSTHVRLDSHSRCP